VRPFEERICDSISYFNYNYRSEDLPSPAERVYLYDGQVSYVPNVSDGDSRLLAGGEDVRALFANRIADPRYISTLVVEP
jgi:hypothetical protein